MIEATPEMCYYCFDTLIEYFNKDNNHLSQRKSYSLLDSIPDHPQCSLFVSWKKEIGNNSELRGCKGTLGGGITLHEGLKYYAIVSGSADRRFESLTEDEIPFLSVSVSILFDFCVSQDCYDWELGEHGIRIDFIDRQQKERTATFLPQVPIQCGWTKKHTIKRLIQKSGCTDRIEFDEDGFPPKYLKLKTIRYRSSLASATHEEYQVFSNNLLNSNNNNKSHSSSNSHGNGIANHHHSNRNGKVVVGGDSSDEDEEQHSNNTSNAC